MPDHKLDRTCSKCQAKAPTAVAVEKWHRSKNWRGPSTWICNDCHELPATPSPRPRRPMSGLRMALLLAAAASIDPPRGR